LERFNALKACVSRSQESQNARVVMVNISLVTVKMTVAYQTVGDGGYHIVTSASQSVSFDQTPLAPLTYLEHRISELSGQGWEV